MSSRDLEQVPLLDNQQPQRNASNLKKKLAVALVMTAGIASAIGIAVNSKHANSQKLNENIYSSVSNSSSFPAGLADHVRSLMNTSVDPCQDFYQFACGAWLARTQIPADKESAEISFSTIGDRNYEILQDVAQENWPVIGTLFDNCMNDKEIDQLGVGPFRDSIGKIFDDANVDVWKLVGDLFFEQVSSFLGIGVVVDAKNPTNYAISIGQNGLTLPENVFYKDAEMINRLRSYLLKMLGLYENAPLDKVQARVDAVIDFEKELANIWIPLSDIRDPSATYNKYSFGNLKKAFSGINWEVMLSSFLAKDQITSVSYLVDSPKYLESLQALISKTDKSILVDYLKLISITRYAEYLPSSFGDAYFEFFGKYLNGIQEMPKRERKCTQVLDSQLGDIIGRYYVERAFSGKSKSLSKGIIESLKSAFGKNLPKVAWMDDLTRKAALHKLEQITDLIGYPDNWTDYSEIYVKPHQFFDNIMVTNRFATQSSIENIGKPVRKDLWQMTAPTVNAYYDPTLNSINFPAGILQPTYFSADYPMAMNYGGIGVIAGHELSHGFDDQGRQYDDTGKLTTWWTNASIANFKTHAQCYIDQYDKFPVYDIHVHGDQTLGENIADNSGVKTSFYAYQNWKSINGEEPRLLPEFTNDQLFFLAYGQGWCAKSTESSAKQRVETDVHSPPQYRVLGPLQNSLEFAQAFQCPKNTRMNPDQKCSLW